MNKLPDPSGTDPIKEKAEEIAAALDDVDSTDLLFSDVRTNPADKMNMLYVANKMKGWSYRWIRKLDILRRKAQGWIPDSEATAMKFEGGKINATHDMILMRIPTEKAKEINDFWRKKGNKIAKSLDFENDGQKKMAKEYLQQRGVPAKLINSIL